MKIANKSSRTIHYNIYRYQTSSPSIGRGDLGPNQIAAYKFQDDSGDGDTLLYCSVYRYTREGGELVELVDATADSTVTFATEIDTGFLG